MSEQDIESKVKIANAIICGVFYGGGLILVALKFIGIIDWSWDIVLAPIYGLILFNTSIVRLFDIITFIQKRLHKNDAETEPEKIPIQKYISSAVGILSFVFIALKLTGLVNWSWGVALAPAYIPIIGGIIIAFFITIYLGIQQAIINRNERRSQLFINDARETLKKISQERKKEREQKI